MLNTLYHLEITSSYVYLLKMITTLREYNLPKHTILRYFAIVRITLAFVFTVSILIMGLRKGKIYSVAKDNNSSSTENGLVENEFQNKQRRRFRDSVGSSDAGGVILFREQQDRLLEKCQD
ncbi:hypothetical protein YC2023_052463 [Brassica napus]